MSELSISIDPLNPGHFYACCGLVELLDREHEWIESRFEWNTKMPRRGSFRLRSESLIDVNAILTRLREAKYQGIGEEVDEEDGDKILPVEVQGNLLDMELDWWLNEFRDKATSLKCWGGRMSSVGIFEKLAGSLDPDVAIEDLFLKSRAVSSRFGVDPRSSWTTIDAGYSLNEQGQSPLTYPAVELLAAFGLQRFRPGSRNREKVTYFTWGEWLHISLAGLAANQPWDGLESRAYEFRIIKRGQGYKYFGFGKPAQD